MTPIYEKLHNKIKIGNNYTSNVCLFQLLNDGSEEEKIVSLGAYVDTNMVILSFMNFTTKWESKIVVSVHSVQ